MLRIVLLQRVVPTRLQTFERPRVQQINCPATSNNTRVRCNIEIQRNTSAVIHTAEYVQTIHSFHFMSESHWSV